MQLDSSYYKKNIDIFEENITKVFCDDMIKISEKFNFRNRGYFSLSYKYFPHNYKIIIENEIRTFDIKIEDSEGASNVLYRIEKFNNSLTAKNIKESILLLKSVLEKNNFNFYFHVGDKLYRKNCMGVIRVKDLKELING